MVFLVALECCGLLPAMVWTSWAAPAAGGVPEPPLGMQYIVGGVYAPLFKEAGMEQPTPVAPFYLDIYPVTNAQYIAFIEANPRWRRSQVSPLLADAAYLRHWQAEAPPPEVATTVTQRPVTYVSWFAARAYCRWHQKRLPSTAEWEYVALASTTAPDGSKDPAYQARLLEWYALPAAAMPPLIGSGQRNYWGISDLHGGLWEWVADFQTAFSPGAARGDTEADDPDRDTPSVLSAYSARMHLDPLSWWLLSGHPDDVLELATLLGIKYKRDQGGGFIHSNVLTVLNKAGEIVHRYEGLQQDMVSTLEAIRRAAQQ